jgi:soluble lytic murein transglycosylase-like protein
VIASPCRGGRWLLAGAIALLVASDPISTRAEPGIERRLATLRRLAPRSVVQPAPRELAPSRCGPETGRRAARRDPGLVDRAIRDASLRFGVSSRLIRSVIRHESAGDPGAVSHRGAIGLMQLMPPTARELGVVCAYHPRQNIVGGTRYLRLQRDRFGSWRRALAAYHAGPARVDRGSIPPETRRYVSRVLATWRR